MKAILLAAGKGVRLKKITRHTPKPMLKLKGEVILEHNLKWLRKYGVKEVCINLHYLPEIIRGYFGDGSGFSVKIMYSYERKILGTAGGVRKIVGDLEKEKRVDNFLVVYGDNFYPLSYDLKGLIDFHLRKDALASIGLYEKKSEVYKSGVAILDRDNLIVDFKEKPDLKYGKARFENQKLYLAKQMLINAGVYVLNRKIIEYLPDGYSDFGKDIFPKLIKRKAPIYGYVFNAPLIAIDTMELYKQRG